MYKYVLINLAWESTRRLRTHPQGLKGDNFGRSWNYAVNKTVSNKESSACSGNQHPGWGGGGDAPPILGRGWPPGF